MSPPVTRNPTGENAMSLNWQDVPRDPIADDEELELLYQTGELHKAASLPSLPTRTPARELDPQTESRVGKVA
jgi:hypothetical protein